MGKEHIMVSLKDYVRTVPDFPIPGVQFRDITGLLEHPQAFDQCINDIRKLCTFANCIIGIESRGFIFGAPVAKDYGIPFVLARKPGKLPNKTVSKKYDLEYGEAELHIQELSPVHGNVVIIDDLIATGGTAIACADLVHENWNIPKENITVIAPIDLPDLGGSVIIAQQGYKVQTLIQYEGE